MKLRYRLNILLTVVVFMIILSTNAVICGALVALYLFGVIDKFHMAPLLVAILSLVVSLVISTVLSGFLIRHFVYPLNALTKATKRVAAGNFSEPIPEDDVGRPRRVMRNNELGILIQSFNEMMRELDSVEIFRRDFISNFSHEFKTPILSIRGFARQLAEDDITPEQRAEFTKIIADESEYLANMSSNILLLTKLEHQQIVTDRREFSLDEQLRDCMLLLESQWSEKGLNVEMDLDEVNYVQNPEILSHVWTNLFSNAVKFTPPEGSITVLCREGEKQIAVTVTDTGIGMDDDIMAHMFEKFYQGDPSRRLSGNGLGLSLVKRITDMVGAQLSYASEVGKGTSFTVVLPK